MKLLSLKLLSVLTSPVRAVVGSPEIKNDNKPDISLTLLTGNQVKIPLIPEIPPVKTCRLGSPLGVVVEQEAEVEVSPDAGPALLGIKGSINDNYCVLSPVAVARPSRSVLNVERQNFSVSVQQAVLCPVASPVPFVLSVRGQSQKKDGSPSLKMKQEIKFVKDAFSVDHCVFAPVPNAHNVVNAHLIGGHLQKFWQKWSLLGANPRVVSILKDGYILPFKVRPNLVRDPLIVSGYANPLRNLYLKQALQALLQKEAVEMVRVRAARGMGDFAGFQRRLFPHSSPCEIPEISRVSFPKSVLSVPGPSL